MAKGKDDKKYTQAQLMALKSSVRTDLVSKSKVGKPTVDPSKGRAPKYENKQKAFDALNTAGRVAAETVALGAGAGALLRPATKIVAKELGKRAAKNTAAATFKANMRGIASSTGAGGKVSYTQTPMGPTLRSTQIGTPKQQAARINNLTIGKAKEADLAGKFAQSKKMIDVFKAGKKVGKAGPTLTGGAVTERNRRSK